METLKKRFIVDENNKKLAVLLDIRTFMKIEEVMENYALFQLMKDFEDDELLELESAKAYYATLEKAKWEQNSGNNF